jgi:phosphohistidine phosphatase SixA
MLRFITVLLTVLFTTQAYATEAGWALLREGGHVILLRHANAPGATEPANFDITKCATQRNLSDRGRQQARRIGALFAARAAPVDQVLASNYCRTRDTAVLAFGASLVEAYEPLDFRPGDEEGNEERADEVIRFILDYTESGNLVMVVNEEVADRLVGVKPREGEAVIVTHDGETLSVAARIRFN